MPGSDYNEIQAIVWAMLGDPAGALYTSADIAPAMAVALGQYAKVVETVSYRVLALAEGGLLGHSLAAWGSGLQEVIYVQWPAAASLPDSSAPNQVNDWWYYRDPAGVMRLDLQVDGGVPPSAGERLVVAGVERPAIAGFTFLGELGLVSTLPAVHFHILALGTAAYCLRAMEARLAANPGGAWAYASAYHVNVLAGLANDLQRQFENELAVIKEKRLERPPWGMPERKRMRRLEAK